MTQKKHQAQTYISCIHRTFQENDIYPEKMWTLTQPALTTLPPQPQIIFYMLKVRKLRENGGIILWILGIIFDIRKKKSVRNIL